METQCIGLLISKAFEKAEQVLTQETGGIPSTNAQGVWLHEQLLSLNNFHYHQRNFITRRKATKEKREVKTMPIQVLNGLSQIIGHESFDAFRIANDCMKESGTISTDRKNRTIKVVVIISIAMVVGLYALVVTFSEGRMKEQLWPFSKGEYMVWKGDRFTQTHYNEIQDRLGFLLPKDEELLDEFRKKHPDSIEAFFDKNEQPLIWYGRGEDGKYEYFTHRGQHPITGKELRPITHYIINTYILSQRLDNLEVKPIE